MEKEKVFVTKDALIEAYKNGSVENKELLKRLYGTEMFRPKNNMDRIKTFDDAVKELGKDHPLVTEYQDICGAGSLTLAFLKLRIITAALNEGWEPKFTEDEYRYYPYFHFYTKQEINEMNKDELANLFVFDKPIGASAGLAYAASFHVPSTANATVGSRLCFKTKELAEYAGKQFIKLYYDFYTK